MKIKCNKCGKIEELTSEQIDEFSEIARKRKLNSGRYMKLFEAVSDTCSAVSDDEDSNLLHEFVLDDKDVYSAIDIYKLNDELERVNSKARDDVLIAIEEQKKTLELMEKGLDDLCEKVKLNIEKREDAGKQCLEKTGIEIESWL